VFHVRFCQLFLAFYHFTCCQIPSEVMSVIDRYAAEKGYGYKDGFSFAVDALWALALGMYMFLVDQTYTI